MIAILLVFLVAAVLIGTGVAFGGWLLAIFLAGAAVLVAAWVVATLLSGRSYGDVVEETSQRHEFLGPGGPDDPDRPASASERPR